MADNHDTVKLSSEGLPSSKHCFREVRLPMSRLPRLILAALMGLALILAASAANAGPDSAFLAKLNPAQQKAFKQWRAAKASHARQLDSYWAQVERKRKARRRKRSKRMPFAHSDYVLTFPPKYQGPALSKNLAQRWARFQAKQAKKKPRRKSRRLPGIHNFLAAAKKHYGFVPTRISEREFKRRYARESLALGLTKMQVVRVYALETGGNGTADMQAGIHPITKKGRPISSALGYAQLLHANTIGELVKHGNTFIRRLQNMRASTRDPARAKELDNKIAALKRMMKSARSVPNNWYRHVSFAKTSRGYGMHAINLDGDIGPWLQSVKLKGLKDFAARKGVTNLSGEEIELMNLSGPATGLEMMKPAGLTAPTTNFFSRRAYYVNKMVMGKTSAELLGEFTRRMDRSSKKPGAIEFAQAFDEVRQARLP